MSIPNPVKPGDNPAADRKPDPQPIVPPDDPNADRIDRAPDIDPPPLEPPLEAPSEKPGTTEPPARACDIDTPAAVGSPLDWMTIGPCVLMYGPGVSHELPSECLRSSN